VRFRYRPSFMDVDFARMIFSGNYYTWVERAFEAWQFDLGLIWDDLIVNHRLGLATVETRCHHLAPIGLMQEFEVELGLRDLDERGFTTDFEVVRLEDGRLSAFGYIRRRFLDMDTHAARAEPPEFSMRIFRQMLASSRLPSYDERVAAYRRPHEAVTAGAPGEHHDAGA
jgi:acyl-CoA thioesterase FadM